LDALAQLIEPRRLAMRTQKISIGRVGAVLQVAALVAVLIGVAVIFAYSFRTDPASFVPIVQLP
jgi:hypothetical protein